MRHLVDPKARRGRETRKLGGVPPRAESAETRPVRAARTSDHKDVMSLAGLLTILDDDPRFTGVLARAEAAGPGGQDLVPPPTLPPLLAAALARGPQGKAPRFVLAVTATAREAEDLAAGRGSLLPPPRVARVPGWETLP